MSTTIVPSPSASPGGTPGATPGVGPGAGAERTLRAVLHRARRDLDRTPGRMRLVAALLVLAGVLLGTGGAQAFRSAQGATQRADANAAQVVRLQDIRTSLLRADADLTNAFLVGGLEPADQRADYRDAVHRAGELVARSAQAQPADGTVLAALAVSVQDYTAQVEQARATNRQGLPLGAQYLREASASLRSQSMPLLQALTAANQQRVQTEFGTAQRASRWLLVAGLLALGGLLAAGTWLARRTRRYLNLRLTGAAAVALCATVAGLLVLGAVGAQVRTVRTGPYQELQLLGEARTAGFDAKANESLTLVSRGSGAAFEKSWAESAGTTTARLARLQKVRPGTGAPDVLSQQWRSYTGLHRAIRQLDGAGRWEDAVTAATSRDAGAAHATFNTWGDRTAAQVGDAGARTHRGLLTADRGLGLAMWLALFAGLAVAALAWSGLAQRIEEYR